MREFLLDFSLLYIETANFPLDGVRHHIKRNYGPTVQRVDLIRQGTSECPLRAIGGQSRAKF